MNITRAFRSLLTPSRLLVVAAATLGVATFGFARPAGASAVLSANPTDVYVPVGQMSAPSVLSWNTGTNQGAEIWVTADGGPESLAVFGAAPQGQTTMQIAPGHNYTFKLYLGTKGAQPAASVTVKGHYAKADLTVKYDGYINGHLRITVKNQGGTASGAYRIAVLAGADSYSIFAGSLAAGASQQFSLSSAVMGCNRPIAILVDADHQVNESNESNNGTGFNTPCLIDNGPVLIPADN